MPPSTSLRRRKKGSEVNSDDKKNDGQAQEARSIENSWQVYILRCADGSLYTGCTNDLTRRLLRHGRRQVKYTRGRLPVELLYQEAAGGRGAALRREVAIKRLRRAQKLALADGQEL